MARTDPKASAEKTLHTCIKRCRELAPQPLDAWRTLRAGLDERRRTRALRYRFRRDPAAYLRDLQALALKRPLPT